MNCPICDSLVPLESSSCAGCGAPADPRASLGKRVACANCEGVVWSLARVCVHCGARDYPGLVAPATLSGSLAYTGRGVAIARRSSIPAAMSAATETVAGQASGGAK